MTYEESSYDSQLYQAPGLNPTLVSEKGLA